MFYRVIFLIYDKRLICYVLFIYFPHQFFSWIELLHVKKIEDTDASEMEFIHQNFTKKFNLILSESFIGHIIILYTVLSRTHYEQVTVISFAPGQRTLTPHSFRIVDEVRG